MPSVALLALALLPSFSPPQSVSANAAQEARDPIAGVWKGVGLGDGRMFSKAGVPVTLLLRRGAGDAVEGQVSVQAQVMEPMRATLEDDGQALKMSGVIGSMPFQATFAIEGERLRGKLAGFGVAVDITAERWSLEVLEAPADRTSLADLASLSEDDWQSDLRFLEEYLPQVHANAFHTVTAEQWRASIEDAVRQVPELDPLQRVLALARIVAGVGDAHTGLNWREAAGFQTLPVWIGNFSDGRYVTGVHGSHAAALGGRIVAVGTTPIDEALRKVAAFSSAENDAWRGHQVTELLAVPRILQLLGLSESPDAVDFALAGPDGEEFTVRVDLDRSQPWVMAPDPKYDPIPRYLRNVSQTYWFELLEEQRAVYMAYNSCREDPARPMAEFVGELLAAFDAGQAQRLVIDLRNNTGGDSSVFSDIAGRLKKHPRIGAPGGLVGLIGPRTFSSGMRAACEIRDELGGLLVGMPTGGKPNSFGELRRFRLPRTGLGVFHSTKRFTVYEDQDPEAVVPDMHIEPSSAEYLAGEDPVLAAALAVQR